MELIRLEELLNLPKSHFYGKVICFPTDTVYGLGAMIDDREAIKKIFKIKSREEKKPLAILVNHNDLTNFVSYISESAKRLMENHWPGPLTLIFNKTDKINDEVNQASKTIAFRMPNSKVTLQIIDHLGFMATTSVNLSGEKELNSITDIINCFGSQIDYIVTDEVVLSKCPSTVIDVTEEEIKVIRQGNLNV